MDYILDFSKIDYYNNNDYYMDLDLNPFSYNNEILYGKKAYFEDKIKPGAIKIKKKVINMDEDISNNYFIKYDNDINRDFNKINNNFVQRKGKPQALNNNNINNYKNILMNFDNYNSLEVPSPLQDQTGIIPFKFKPMLQKPKNTNNNNNILKRNKINQDLKHKYRTLKKNINNKMNNNNPSINNKHSNHILYLMKNLNINNQFNPYTKKNPIYTPSNINMKNNFY